MIYLPNGCFNCNIPPIGGLRYLTLAQCENIYDRGQYQLGTKEYDNICVLPYKHNILLCKCQGGLQKRNGHIYCGVQNIATFCWNTVTQHVDRWRLLFGNRHKHFFAEGACHVWSEVSGAMQPLIYCLSVRHVLCLGPWGKYQLQQMHDHIFAA